MRGEGPGIIASPVQDPLPRTRSAPPGCPRVVLHHDAASLEKSPAESGGASSTTTGTKGGANPPDFTIGRAPSRARRRHRLRLHVLMPWRAATATTVAPGSWLSETIRACSATRPTPLCGSIAWKTGHRCREPIQLHRLTPPVGSQHLVIAINRNKARCHGGHSDRKQDSAQVWGRLTAYGVLSPVVLVCFGGYMRRGFADVAEGLKACAEATYAEPGTN